MDRLTAALVTWLASLPPWASWALMTGVIVGSALLGVWLLRRMTAHETVRRHHDVGWWAALIAFVLLVDIQLNFPFVGVEAIDAAPFTRLAG